MPSEKSIFRTNHVTNTDFSYPISGTPKLPLHKEKTPQGPDEAIQWRFRPVIANPHGLFALPPPWVPNQHQPPKPHGVGPGENAVSCSI